MRKKVWIVWTSLVGYAATVGGQVEPVTVIRGAEHVEIVTPTVFSGSLLDLPVVRSGRIDDVSQETPVWDDGPATESSTVNLGPPPAAFPGPILNFDGHGYNALSLPNMFGDVGPSYYIQTVEGTFFTIYNKVDGSIVAGPSSLGDIGDCSPVTYPAVLYDHLSVRWLMSGVNAEDDTLCVYVSQTDDPISGGWFVYSFSTPGSFPDFPMYAVWPDAYYVTTNEAESAVYALERDKMLTGAPASMQRFTAPDLAGFGFQAMTPSDLDGALTPPVGAPARVVRHRDDEVHNSGSNDPSNDFLEIWAFSVDWTNPANSTFSHVQDLPIGEFSSDLCGLTAFSCFPQPGSGALLDPLREVVGWRSVYRNFGTHEALVGSFVTDVGVDHGGVRWYELRKIGHAPWSLFQEGTHAPDSDNRWLGSIALDREGNIGLGYNVTSSTTYPGLRYTGRLVADPVGTLRSETVLIEGSAANLSNRYGNQSSITVDPSDGCTFWYTGEYNASSQWSTRIGTFSLCQCPDTRTISGVTVSDTQILRAVASIEVGPAFDVTGTADLTLRAGEMVSFMNGVRIAKGATLRVEISNDPCN